MQNPCHELTLRLLFEQATEGCRYRRREVHTFARHGMGEAQHIGMQTEAVQRVVAIAIFDVAADRMTHIGRMYTYLVLTSGFKLVFHKRVLGSAVENMIVGHSIFASVVYWRRVGDISLVVLQPIGYGAVVILHLATCHSYVAAVVDYLVPVVLKNLFGINILGVNHQSGCVAVETMHHVGTTLLMRLGKIVVEHRLHVQRRVSGCHGQNAYVLFYYDNPAVFVDNLDKLVLEIALTFVAANADGVAGIKRCVELCYNLAVDSYAMSLQYGLGLGAAFANGLEQVFK